MMIYLSTVDHFVFHLALREVVQDLSYKADPIYYTKTYIGPIYYQVLYGPPY